MKMTKMLALLLAVLMTATLFAGCSKEEPGETTSAPKAETTTAAPETTTPEPIKFGGYQFELGHASGLNISAHEGTALGDELKDIYASIEEELDVKIVFTDPGNEAEDLLTFVMGGTKGADFIRVRQFAWIPLSVRDGLRPLDTQEMLDAGLDLYNPDNFNQYYTNMAKLNDHIWGLDVSGKFYQMSFGHVYAFNKRLVQEAGYEPESLFQAVRDYKWDYDMFLEIARKITKDTDGDGQYDIWGVALDCDGNEIWSNGTGPIIKDESTGKWVANLRDPRILKSMEFMKNVSGDPQVQFPLEGEAVPNRGGRRTIFYEGKAGFAGLYGKNFGDGGTFQMTDPVGLLPIPKGPDVDHYMINMVDTDSFIMLSSNADWEKSAKIMNEIGRLTYDGDEYRAFIEECLQYDEDSIEMLFDYLLPYAKMNIAKPSRDMYDLVRMDFYDAIYKGNVSPAAAAEMYEGPIQAELDNVFMQ
jgi:ABC-type glycerol-3-phosphate transport system substrate-binding protein